MNSFEFKYGDVRFCIKRSGQKKCYCCYAYIQNDSKIETLNYAEVSNVNSAGRCILEWKEFFKYYIGKEEA